MSCTSASFCLAVGDYTYGAGAAMPGPAFRDRILAEEWTGRTWRMLPAVNVGRRDELTAVSCTAPARCTAVGTSAQQFPLAEQWNGSSWRIEHVAVPGALGYTQLSAVSCISARACMTVGDYQGLPIAESWAGGSWRLQWLPRPPADNYSAHLYGVSCMSQEACSAVGVSGNGVSYAEQWHGTTWRLAETANPG